MEKKTFNSKLANWTDASSIETDVRIGKRVCRGCTASELLSGIFSERCGVWELAGNVQVTGG